MIILSYIILALLIINSYFIIIFHKIKMKKYEEYREFTKFVTKTVQDIEDEKYKLEASEFFLLKLKSNKDIKRMIMNLDIEKIKAEFYEKWGKHLPGYLEEERDRKIQSLGI